MEYFNGYKKSSIGWHHTEHYSSIEFPNRAIMGKGTQIAVEPNP